MKKKAIILVGILLISSIFMISASANYSQTISQNPCPSGSGVTAIDTFFVFTGVPKNPTGDGTLTIKVRGDYNDYDTGDESEAIGVIVEGTSIGTWLPGQECDYSLSTKAYTVTQEQLREWAADGKIEVTLVQGAALSPDDEGIDNEVDCFCSIEGRIYEGGCDPKVCGTINMVTLEYEGTNNSLPMNWIMKKFGLGKEK